MDEVPDYVMKQGRAALTKRFASAHERLAVSSKIDGALLSTAFDGCFHHVTVWAPMAHERLGAQLSTAEKNHVADALRIAMTDEQERDARAEQRMRSSCRTRSKK